MDLFELKTLSLSKKKHQHGTNLIFVQLDGLKYRSLQALHGQPRLSKTRLILRHYYYVVKTGPRATQASSLVKPI